MKLWSKFSTSACLCCSSVCYIPFEHVELLRCGMRDDGCEGCEWWEVMRWEKSFTVKFHILRHLQRAVKWVQPRQRRKSWQRDIRLKELLNEWQVSHPWSDIITCQLCHDIINKPIKLCSLFSFPKGKITLENLLVFVNSTSHALLISRGPV